MSAQVLLSMIAPALPATPQGSPDGDAMAFEGLLAAMMDAGGSLNDSAPDAIPTEGDLARGEDASIQTVAVMMAATPVVLATLPPAAGTEDAQGSTPPSTPAPTETFELPTLPPVLTGETLSSAQIAAPAGSAPPANPVAQAILDKAGMLKAENPADAASPPAVDTSSADESQTQPPASPPVLKTGAETLPVQPPPAQPQPLRALAERTSKPSGNALVADASTPADLRGSTVSAAATPPQAVAPSGGKAEASVQSLEAPLPAAHDAAGTLDQPAGEGQLPETASATPAVHMAREAAVPTMSRAAIDATAQIAAQILRKLDGRNTRFEMALTPDELGRVDVKLDIDSEGRLSARLAFDNPAAAADLRGRTDELRRQLEQAGFHVADDAFEFTERDSGSSAFDRGQDARDGQNRAFARASRLNTETDAALLAPRWTPLTLSPSGVDLKV